MRRSIIRAAAFASAELFAGAVGSGCDSHDVPAQPTWADVEPIVRGACLQCHGSNAPISGSSYRFDFYDMTSDVCGDAAAALAGQGLAHSLSALIGTDVTPPGSGWRARMPPSPAQSLLDWQRETLQRWAAKPQRGLPHGENRRPEIQLSAASAMVDKSLPFSAVVSDPDGEAVAGVLKIGDAVLAMDRAGTFGGAVDTSAWPNGTQPISAVLCDGWDSVTYELGNVLVNHPAPPATGGAAGQSGAGGVGGAAGQTGAGGAKSPSGAGGIGGAAAPSGVGGAAAH
ncbi:MAG TPA: hypothetical protein VGP07_04905 [Polyangia bacterium]|jgi:hypothetical protein